MWWFFYLAHPNFHYSAMLFTQLQTESSTTTYVFSYPIDSSNHTIFSFYCWSRCKLILHRDASTFLSQGISIVTISSPFLCRKRPLSHFMVYLVHNSLSICPFSSNWVQSFLPNLLYGLPDTSGLWFPCLEYVLKGLQRGSLNQSRPTKAPFY